MSDWDKYIDQIVHKLNEDETEFEVMDVCSSAAIYGKDGTCWAYSEKMPELKCYVHEIDGMGEIIKVKVNELELAIKAGEGEKESGRGRKRERKKASGKERWRERKRRRKDAGAKNAKERTREGNNAGEKEKQERERERETRARQNNERERRKCSNNGALWKSFEEAIAWHPRTQRRRRSPHTCRLLSSWRARCPFNNMF